MRLDLFLKKNILIILKNCRDFSDSEKKELLKIPRFFWQKEINLGNIKILKKSVKPSHNVDIAKISSVNIAWKNIKKNWNTFYRKHLFSYPVSLQFVLIQKDFLVVNKPAGIAVHPVFPLSRGVPRNVSLIEGIVSYYPETESAGLAHRLDKETSGVLLVARNPETKKFLKKQFKNRGVKKVYYALVEGILPYNKFSLRGKIGKSQKNPILRKMASIEIYDLKSNDRAPAIIFSGKIINPKDSLTFGEKVASGSLDELRKAKQPINKIVAAWKKYLKNSHKKFTLLKLTPETGRTHQIRVHLSTLGFPIVGDKLYGKNHYKSLPLHCLHAFSLEWSDSQGDKHTVRIPNLKILDRRPADFTKMKTGIKIS